MTEESVNRREFGKKLAVGAAGVPFAAELADAGDEPDDKEKKPEPAKPLSEADLLLEVIKQRYPNENLTEDVLQQIRGSIRGKIGRGNFLSNYPLKNSDEPGFVFGAYRDDNV